MRALTQAVGSCGALARVAVPSLQQERAACSAISGCGAGQHAAPLRGLIARMALRWLSLQCA